MRPKAPPPPTQALPRVARRMPAMSGILGHLPIDTSPLNCLALTSPWLTSVITLTSGVPTIEDTGD
eukprot:915205-Alexandrium_andersonii.AAC.1